MIYLFCSTALRASGARLHTSLRDHLDKVPIHLIPSIDGLRQQLCQPHGDGHSPLVVFLADGHVELSSLHELTDFLRHTPLVLLIKEQSEENISMAHSLFPRFLGCLDDDYLMITKVIENILTSKTASATLTTS